MIHYWHQSNAIRDSIYIPKYYNPELLGYQLTYGSTHSFHPIASLVRSGLISTSTGDEIGKAAYGTGDIPFVRTSDISNWEIKGSPKQGVSHDIYSKYAPTQDVRVGDILFVRDGTYLIGTNCFIADIDKEILFQSHVLKLRVHDHNALNPYLLFLALNNPWVQRQVRAVQFTADIIDTIGDRFYDIVLPLPKRAVVRDRLTRQTADALQARMKGKAFIKHCPKLIEEALRTGQSQPIDDFLALDPNSTAAVLSNETVTAEFGTFTSFWHDSSLIKDQVYLPTYYDVSINMELELLEQHCVLRTFDELVRSGSIEYHTGDEVGKMAYGTGSIPFIRTTDFANWEISHNPKQGVSEELYHNFEKSQDVRENDILLVRDGTYLVGSSCIITSRDVKCIFCGGLIKIRVLDGDLDAHLLLGLMNSYIVKRQIRTKQFTRDVIDTLGNRLDEVVLPIPKSARLRRSISDAVQQVVVSRITARDAISTLTREIAPDE